jgi:SpoVK/Ycf46/Vps4 family AAA+-type ATPase
LFVSPDSAAGRTAASVLANELGVGLYRIDLSAVVGKFIGETEKNLSAVFADAEAAGAILFIDEADALFGKRSEVKDAHDRFANMEVNYLLQRLEDFNGLVVLASNSRDNVDPAIVRRVDYVVELPRPGKPPKSHSAAR